MSPARRRRALLALVIVAELVAIANAMRVAWPVNHAGLLVGACVLGASLVSFAVGLYLGREERQRVLERELAAARSINRTLVMANTSAVGALRREARRRIGELADGREVN